jgi:hypothetical protein
VPKNHRESQYWKDLNFMHDSPNGGVGDLGNWAGVGKHFLVGKRKKVAEQS